MQQIPQGNRRFEFEHVPTELEESELIQFFVISDSLQQFLVIRRGDHNRLGLAMHWCWLEYLGWQPRPFDGRGHVASAYVGAQLNLLPKVLGDYATVASQWYRHTEEVRIALGWQELSDAHERELLAFLAKKADGILDKRELLRLAVDWCRSARIIRPGLTTLERMIAAAVVEAEARFDINVVKAVSRNSRRKLISKIERLIKNQGLRKADVSLQKLRGGPGHPSQKNMNELLDNIVFMRRIGVESLDLSHLSVMRRKEYVKDAARASPADFRDFNKPKRIAMVLCLLADLWASHHNDAPQMHRRLLRESRDRAEGKRRKSLLSRITDMIFYVRMLAQVFRIARDPALSAETKISNIITLADGEQTWICPEICRAIHRSGWYQSSWGGHTSHKHVNGCHCPCPRS